MIIRTQLNTIPPMKPNRKISTVSVGELTQQLVARKTIPTRFSIDLPYDDVAKGLYAAYIAEVHLRGRELKVDDDTKRHLKAATEWLIDANGKFGFMMTGLYGNGKTTLMKAMCNLINYLFDSDTSFNRMTIRILKAKEIARRVIEKDWQSFFDKIVQEELLAIDELGEEPAEILHYGIIYTPIRDLLEERYARQKFTIVATNLVQNKEKSLSQITDHYGERVVDRFREMMKIVPFRNPSYRADPKPS